MRRYYISDTQGNIRFTQAGSAFLAPLFSKHGIDIHKIRNRRDYVMARLAVRPYYLMEKWLSSQPDETQPQFPSEKSNQHQLLMAAVFSNHSPEKFQRMITDYRRRSLFLIIDGGL